MKESKDVRRFSHELFRASFVDGRLDRSRISQITAAMIEKKPRSYIKILDSYKRLLRLEVEKRHARIESATELKPETSAQIVEGLQKKYGGDLTTEFVVNPALLGGVRIRVGSDVWDSSVRNRLQRLQEQL